MKGGARGCGNGQVAGWCSCECEKWMTGWNDVLYCAGWQGSCRCEGSKGRKLVPFITKQIWPLQPSASTLMGKKYSGMLLYPQLTPLSGEKEIPPASTQKDRSRVKNRGRETNWLPWEVGHKPLSSSHVLLVGVHLPARIRRNRQLYRNTTQVSVLMRK